MGTPAPVRARCREVIASVAGDGGFIMDASAIVQNDAKIANLVVMVEATREFGVYSGGAPAAVPALDHRNARPGMLGNPAWATKSRIGPGECEPFAEEHRHRPALTGDDRQVERLSRQTGGMANMFA